MKSSFTPAFINIDDGTGFWLGCLQQGWPLAFRRANIVVTGDRYTELRRDNIRRPFAGQPIEAYIQDKVNPASLRSTEPEILPGGLAVDSAIALALLFFIGLLSEWLFRRREARKA